MPGVGGSNPPLATNKFKNKKDLKNSEKKSKGIFCLPLYPELRSSEINKIIFSLKRIITEM